MHYSPARSNKGDYRELVDEPIALTPVDGGGMCIGEDALQPADIIVSTTSTKTSAVIRIGTGASVSHALLYIGSGNVIEAIGGGVTRRSLKLSLADDSLAVAYRSPKMTPGVAKRIIEFVSSKIGVPYSVSGAALSDNKILCQVIGARPAGFFCSQLVFEGYRQSGLPLSNLPSNCITPGDAVVIAQSQLTYIGHLLGNPSWFPTISP